MIIVTPAAIALAKSLIIKSESFESKPYKNAHDVWTNGYGNTNGVTAKTPPCTVAQALVQLTANMAEAINEIKMHVQHVLTDHQVAALIDFTFNLGCGAFDTSTILKEINASDLADVPAQLLRWVHDSAGNVLPGLVARRKIDVTLWNTPDTITGA